ncbi:MAG: ABC-F family ATP-binding cassette domain-containing protein [Solirubrobacteraceae bacterium]
MASNLVNLSSVSKGYASRTVLSDVTCGVAEGERIGVVGRNGEGKSTLLRLIAGLEEPDTGAVVRNRGLLSALLHQGDELGEGETVADVLLADRPGHEIGADRRLRSVLEGLLGGVSMSRLSNGPATLTQGLSGGERRRVALSRLLLGDADLLALDEPTNHLDVEAITWLAGFLSARRGAILVVTHDRWFLDAVCTSTWEIDEQTIHPSEGGYAAYVLARAERDRLTSVREEQRRQLVRKELAWLRRGPPARTTKPKFRIEAANALIADEPPARDRVELLRFAGSRLGDKVLDAVDVALSYSTPSEAASPLLRGLTWRLGPGDRFALVGANGSGKTTLLKLLAGELAPDAGVIERGQTVKLAYLSQDAVELPREERVLESLERVRRRATLSDGREITAGMLVERFGFRGDRARTKIVDLSGGERRRLALMRLLMAEPNVLLLDEPTNDLDIDTLTAFEDLLDGWPGTLVIVSHDRYFVERVTDDVYALLGDGGITHLPGGMDQYLELQRAPSIVRTPARAKTTSTTARRPAAQVRQSAAALRTARKEAQRLERALERSTVREQELHEQMAAAATDHVRLGELQAELSALTDERDGLESAWLEAAAVLEASG